MKLFDPMASSDPRQCLAQAYEHALCGGQSLVVRTLGGTRIGHIIDGDVLRLQQTARRYVEGKFRFIPQMEGLYRVDLLGGAFEKALRESE